MKRRWLLAALAVVLWVLWLVMCWARYEFDLGRGYRMVTEILRVLAEVSVILLVLVALVAPMAATLRVGRDIGRAEAERSDGKVIPISRRSIGRD